MARGGVSLAFFGVVLPLEERNGFDILAVMGDSPSQVGRTAVIRGSSGRFDEMSYGRSSDVCALRMLKVAPSYLNVVFSRRIRGCNRLVALRGKESTELRYEKSEGFSYSRTCQSVISQARPFFTEVQDLHGGF